MEDCSLAVRPQFKRSVAKATFKCCAEVSSLKVAAPSGLMIEVSRSFGKRRGKDGASWAVGVRLITGCGPKPAILFLGGVVGTAEAVP